MHDDRHTCAIEDCEKSSHIDSTLHIARYTRFHFASTSLGLSGTVFKIFKIPFFVTKILSYKINLIDDEFISTTRPKNLSLKSKLWALHSSNGIFHHVLNEILKSFLLLISKTKYCNTRKCCHRIMQKKVLKSTEKMWDVLTPFITLMNFVSHKMCFCLQFSWHNAVQVKKNFFVWLIFWFEVCRHSMIESID